MSQVSIRKLLQAARACCWRQLRVIPLLSIRLPVIHPRISGAETFILLLSFPTPYSSMLIRYPHSRYIINRHPQSGHCVRSSYHSTHRIHIKAIFNVDHRFINTNISIIATTFRSNPFYPPLAPHQCPGYLSASRCSGH